MMFLTILGSFVLFLLLGAVLAILMSISARYLDGRRYRADARRALVLTRLYGNHPNHVRYW